MLFLRIENTGDPYPALDEVVLDQYGIECPPESNTVLLQGGYDPSVVCMILPVAVLDLITKPATTHRVILTDAGEDGVITINIDGLVFDRAELLDASLTREYGNPAAVVYLADKRLLFKRSLTSQLAYNLVSPYVTEPGSYDADVAASFPYDPTSLNSGEPFTWESLFLALWNELPSHGDFPSLGTHVSYPITTPVDIRPENRNDWRTFIDLAHSIGWEIFPKLDGTFLFAAIDDNYGQTSDLPDDLILEKTFPQPEDVRLPTTISVAFQTRNLSGSLKNWQPFYFQPVATSSVVPGGLDPAPDYVVGDNEIITSLAMTAVFRSDATLESDPENLSDLTYLASYIATRYVKQRLNTNLNDTFSGFISNAPRPEFPIVEYHANEHGPVTIYRTRGYDLSPREIAHVDNSGGGSTDIKVVLIEDDIPGMVEEAPANLLKAEDIPLTDDEIADGWVGACQEPAADDLTTNLVDKLNLRGCRRGVVSLKVFESNGTPNSGTAQGDGGDTDTIQLVDTASTVDDFFNGDIITTTGGAGSGQTAIIIDYDGESLTATVSTDWATAVDATTEYTITSARDLKLATTTVDDTENKKRIARFVTIDAKYDKETFKVGLYGRNDYLNPIYPENEKFPPDGTGTYEAPAGPLKKSFRGYVIGGVLLIEFCVAVPPLPFTERAP